MSMMEYYERKQEYDNKNVNKRTCRRRDSVSEWISVKDRMPEIGEMVLVCTSGGVIDTAWRTSFSEPSSAWDTFSGRYGFMPKYFTHWMPLPEPPKEG